MRVECTIGFVSFGGLEIYFVPMYKHHSCVADAFNETLVGLGIMGFRDMVFSERAHPSAAVLYN